LGGEVSHKPTLCVWELVPVWHEQQAWVRFLTRRAMRPRRSSGYAISTPVMRDPNNKITVNRETAGAAAGFHC